MLETGNKGKLYVDEIATCNAYWCRLFTSGDEWIIYA